MRWCLVACIQMGFTIPSESTFMMMVISGWIWVFLNIVCSMSFPLTVLLIMSDMLRARYVFSVVRVRAHLGFCRGFSQW